MPPQPALLAALAREWATGFELIAIDDGSRDGSAPCWPICDHPKERRRCWRAQARVPQPATRASPPAKHRRL